MESGKPNCDGVCIPLYSTLDIEAWNKYLPLHNDGRLIEFLNYGFPLGVQGSVLARKTVKNHPSALAFPTHVSEFLRKEVQLGAMLGPLDDIPFQQCHFSPFSLPNDRRIIVDLSFGGEGSVNGCTPRGIYDGQNYILTLPSLDYLLNDIMNTCNPRLIKVDIA